MSNVVTYSTFAESPIAGLEPGLFWRHFYEISRIPRPSGSEQAVGDYLVRFAEKLGLQHRRDETGNVVIRKPATKGHESSKGVILQSHLDMVCEKNKDMEFDFSKDPIRLKREGDYVGAVGTSLGADNLAGIAASLAVLESSDLVHPPLECLFTVDEETGMTGAKNLQGDFLAGRRLLNLDSEEEGDIFVGCAGGVDNLLRFPLRRVAPEAGTSLKVRIEGLKGGHSGLEIHEGRGNALKILGRFLWNLLSEIPYSLAGFSGGNKRNAIPREAESVIVLNGDHVPKVSELAATFEKIFLDEYTPVEAGLKIKIEEGKMPEQVYSKDTTRAFLDLVYLIPHGVLSMSRTIRDLVETSTNLAIIREDKDEICFELSHRSSSRTAKESVNQATAAMSRLCNIKQEVGAGYPGWQPDMSSALLKQAETTYRNLYNKDVRVKAVHAGLECGLIGEKFPGMDMISFGPTLKNVHSPDEVIYIPSVDKFFRFLVQLLTALA